MSDLYKVDILLSTYNGEKYLKEQLDSIVRQSERDWRIIVRDDGSSDGTLNIILKRYQDELGSKLLVIPGNNVGVAGSFSALLDQSTAPYVMFCDQDDVWFEDKIEVMLGRIQAGEKRCGAAKPLLAFSNLTLVDQDGKSMKADFWSYHGINPYHSSLNRLLLQNVVTGCACMFNRALLEISKPIPREAILHDWWFALNATLFGELLVLDRPTVYYRQHTLNQVGARGINLSRLRKLWQDRGSMSHRLTVIFQRTATQASGLIVKYGSVLAPEQRRLINEYSQLPAMGALGRKLFLLKEQIYFSSVIRNICLLLC